MNDLLYVIPANSKKEDIIATLKQHPEIKFVSLVGIDLAGNDTDEKIPMRVFLEDIDSFYNGSAVQTDGSSVVLTGIATLNNAKVDMPIDPTVNWFVDYNIESYDDELGKPVGTLRIPAALIHDGKAVDSRSILANTLTYVKQGLLDLFKNNAKISGLEHINGADVKDIVFTSATELEFWVKTPLSEADIPEMSASQVMQEQYWQRTRGAVRTALEQCMLALEAYGLSPEMGHKEVGGMKGHMDTDGNMTHVCEQVEIDWKFADALQAAEKMMKERMERFQNERYTVPISKFRTLTKSMKFYEVLDDVELIIHVRAADEILNDIFEHRFDITSIGRSEDFISLEEAKFVELQEKAGDEIESEYSAYIDSNLLKEKEKKEKGKRILLDRRYGKSGGTIYSLNKNYTIKNGKRFFEKKKVLYVSRYAVVEFGDGLYLDTDGNKNYIVNFF